MVERAKPRRTKTPGKCSKGGSLGQMCQAVELRWEELGGHGLRISESYVPGSVGHSRWAAGAELTAIAVACRWY